MVAKLCAVLNVETPFAKIYEGERLNYIAFQLATTAVDVVD